MELKVVRKIFTEKSTIGDLYVDGVFQCRTLEDKDRGLDEHMTTDEIAAIKVQNETAIPKGTYAVVINHSIHFNRDLPQILGVPGYEGVRIHSGNTDVNTSGCVLVGETYGVDVINDSRKAFGELFEKMKAATDKIIITITSEPATV